MAVGLVVIAKRGNPVIALSLDYFVVPLLVMTVNELSLAVDVIAKRGNPVSTETCHTEPEVSFKTHKNFKKQFLF